MHKKMIDKKLNTFKKNLDNIDNEVIFQKNLRELQFLIKKEDKHNSSVERLIAKILYNKRDYDKAIEYYNLSLSKNDNNSICYLGLFYSYVKINNFSQALIFLEKYENECLINETNINVNLIKSMLKKLISGKKENIEISTIYFMKDLDELVNGDLIYEFTELQINYNKGNYQECFHNYLMLKDIIENNGYKLDLSILESFLLQLDVRQQQIEKDNNLNLYEKLREAKLNNEPYLTSKLLKEIISKPLQDNELVYSSIFFIINAGLTKEANDMLVSLSETHNNREIIRVLKQSIKNKEKYENYEQEEIDYIEQTLILSKYYFKNGDNVKAYNTLTAAYYIIPYPIFLYYIGEILYSTYRPIEAIYYFEEYAKTGTENLFKTYIKLCNCYVEKFYITYSKTTFQEKKEIQNKIDTYWFYSNSLKKMYDQERPIKRKVLIRQNKEIKRIAPDAFKLTRNEYIDVIRDCYLFGSVTEADLMLKNLMQQQNKTAEEEQAIDTINEYKTIYLSKRSYINN